MELPLQDDENLIYPQGKFAKSHFSNILGKNARDVGLFIKFLEITTRIITQITFMYTWNNYSLHMHMLHLQGSFLTYIWQ